ncbi:MAG TPA: CHAD domain-containing protein [Gemmatimonadales bacterium]|nr:CHAD domain-containing protein [Gemmatimonadales bacterium]
MPLPEYLLDLPAEEAARLIALSLLDRAAIAAGRLADPSDPQALHDFRVAMRRLVACLQAYRPEIDGSVSSRIRRQLRRLARVTTRSRDLEVHLTWDRQQEGDLTARQRAGLRWHLGRLEARRRRADRAVFRNVDTRFRKLEPRLRRRLEVYRMRIERDPARRRHEAAAVLGSRIRKFGGDLEWRLAEIGSIEDERQSHRARLAAKRLRYLLEPIRDEVHGVEPLIERLRTLQDHLGELHDSQTLQADLAAALLGAGEEHARRLSRAVRMAAKGDGIADDAGEDPRPGLLTLIRRLRAREERAFARLEAEWLDGAAGSFFEEVTALGKRIAHRPSCVAEIERKFVLRQVPTTARQMPTIEIEQGWLPGTRLVERMRRWRDDRLEVRYRTVKPGTGPSGDEVEEATARGLFEDVWPLTQGRRVVKRRHEVPDYGLTWGIEQFLDRDLVLAQVQLAGEEPALPLPEWLEPYVVREVTGEREYSNRALAR